MRHDYVFEGAFEGAVDHSALTDEICALFGKHAVRGEERWGSRTVHRVIVQFRAEFRVGERESQLSVVYRSCCSPEDRNDIASRLHTMLSAFTSS